ncbi:MAG: ABC transporter ATP-binding protein [Pseudonocardiaceae bacterium]
MPWAPLPDHSSEGNPYRLRMSPEAPSTPASHDRSELLATAARDNAHFDYFHVLLRNKQTTRSVRGFWMLLRNALATVWSAARLPFVAALLLALFNVLIAVAQVLVAQRLLGTLLADTSGVRLGPLLPPALTLAGLTAVSFALTAATGQVQRLLGELVMRDTHRKMLDVTTTVPLDAYETPWFFNYVVRVETNALTKPLDLVQAVITLISGLAAAVALGIVLVGIEPLLLPLLVATALPSYLINRRGSRHEFDFAVEQSASLRERTYLGNVLKTRDVAKEVRAFELAGLLRGRWEQRYRDYLCALRRLVNRRLRLSVGSALVSGALLVATMLFLLWRVETGHVALASAGAALVAMRMLAARLQAVAGGSNTLFESQLFLDDLAGFLQLGAALSTRPGPAACDSTPCLAFDRLMVDHVSYAYPGSDQKALDDVSLSIERGEIVALVGENGSGKTTLAKLLAGLHQPSAGTVTWNGISLAEMDPQQLRRNVAVIFQDFARYELSALENIAVGRAHDRVDPAAVRAAATHAGAASFLEALPEGYDTLLSKALAGGVDLSLGQWQRVALARAIYRDAGFVVLDEPTSALDPRAEHDLFARMRDVLKARTILLISHRFSSVRHADRIYVLDGGRIVEHGSHDELVDRGGLYAELFTLQAVAYLER